MTFLTPLTLVRWLHLLAVAVWLGGSIFLMFVLHPTLRRTLASPQYVRLVSRIARRFRPWGLGALGVLIITGIGLLIGTWPAGLPGGAYRAILVAKLALVALLLGLTILHDFVLGRRFVALAREAGNPHGQEETRRLQEKAKVLGRLTTLLGLLILLAAAGLASLH